MHYSIRGGPATDVIDVLAPATPQRHSAGFARLLRTSRLPARAPRKRNGSYVKQSASWHPRRWTNQE